MGHEQGGHRALQDLWSAFKRGDNLTPKDTRMLLADNLHPDFRLERPFLLHLRNTQKLNANFRDLSNIKTRLFHGKDKRGRPLSKRQRERIWREGRRLEHRIEVRIDRIEEFKKEQDFQRQIAERDLPATLGV